MGDASGKKSSSSKQTSSNVTTTTNTNIDRRQVVGEGGLGLASDNSVINIQSMDAGIVKDALATADNAILINGALTDSFFGRAQNLATQSNALVAQSNSLNAGVFNSALSAISTADAAKAEGFKSLLDASSNLFGDVESSINQSTKTNGDGFSALVNLADKLFSGAGRILSDTQAATLGQIGALNTAQNDAKGAIDQKTIMVMVGVAGAVAVSIALGGKK